MTLADLLARASARITRHEPGDALAAMQAGALLVDIRSDDARRRNGIVPGALHIPRTVLEWRLAADSEWRNPHVPAGTFDVVLLCDDGYSSILAAASLVELGFARAGDVIGGYTGWRRAGLPTGEAPPAPEDELAGMGGPDQTTVTGWSTIAENR